MILVTGITGHSGRWLSERLIKENFPDKIRCIVRNTSDTSIIDNCTLNIEKMVGDLADVDLLDKAMHGVDTVLHIVGIKMSEKITEAAIRNGVKWLILVHTTGRYSKYKSAASEYIRIEDDILKLRGQIAITILRPTMIYGSSRDCNMYKLVDYLYRHTFFPLFGKGNNLMQPVHARDLGNAYYDVLVHKAETINREYNLSGREPIKYKDIIKSVSHALKKKNVMFCLPIRLSIAAAKVYNLVFKQKALINVEQVMRMDEDKAFSHEEASRDFGYDPIGFKEGIEEEVREYLQSIH